MKIIADLQIHSKYSRATSSQMVIEELARWAKLKGINVMGTGDFTHPLWLRELKEKLKPAEPGLFIWKDDPSSEKEATRFMLTAETSHIYTKNNQVRRIHLLIWAPSFETVEKINQQLLLRGANLSSDGRPIMGIDSKELVKIVLEADERAMVIPAHAWTPWFSVFGSMSGFDSLEECFDEMTSHIYAIETGLSSDPAMNWRLSQLDRVTIVSNSDSHSLQKIGREANVFDTELSYNGIVEAVRSKDREKFLYTIEFFPEEGKYHYDGHRNCKYSVNPSESRSDVCPVCGRKMTIGVLHRVEKLADRPVGYTPPDAIPFKSLVPLNEIVAESFGMGVASKRVKAEYENLVNKFGSEFKILLDTGEPELKAAAPEEVAEGIMRVREGKLHIEPGYDGEYGKIKIFDESERQGVKPQKALF